MGDPISIVGVVVDLAPRVIKYIVDVKHASRDRQALPTEVINTSGILSMLKHVLDQPDEETTWAKEMMCVDGMKDALAGIEDILQTLSKNLKPKNGHFRNSMGWPFKSKDMEAMLDKIARHKQQMILALQLHAFRDMSMADAQLRGLAIDQQQILSNISILLQQVKVDDSKKALSWLSKFDYKKSTPWRP